MPLVKLQFAPGINKEVTSLAGKGGWYACNNVRFRSGYPEKIGGWTVDGGTTTSAYKPAAGNYWGLATALFDWASLSSYNYLAVGTNLKYYIQGGNGSSFNDITPIRYVTTAGAVTFTTVAGQKTITVTSTTNGATPFDFVTFSGATSTDATVTAAILNAEFQVQSIVNANQFTVLSSVAATSSATIGGASTVGTFQILTGSSAYSVGTGWGTGGWGGITPGNTPTGWGVQSNAGLGIGYQIRMWSQSNYGQNLVFCARGGPIYYWAVSSSPANYTRAQKLSPTNTSVQDGIQYWYTDAGAVACPTVANYVLISDQSRFTIAYGTDNLGSGVQDPLLVSWSDQENINVWYPSATNQAGNYRLSQGSQIITALQTRQEILVWTDTALYSQQYLGPPYVWGFQSLTAESSLISPNAVVTANNMVFWMGIDKFYAYNGVVQTLPSKVRKYVFENMNIAQAWQVFAGLNEGFSEIWWYYCSTSSRTVDSYVIYNYVENTWAYGNTASPTAPGYAAARTAWTYSPIRAFPIAAGYAANGTDGTLIYHENGVDDGTTNPPSAIQSFAQSSDVDIGSGDRYGFGWRIIPDVSFDSSNVPNPSCYMTLIPRQNPGAAYTIAVTPPAVNSTQSYSLTSPYQGTQQFTTQVNIRVRGREIAMVVGSNTVGTAWSLGVPRMEVRPDGRRA